jgi:hypothetical protein
MLIKQISIFTQNIKGDLAHITRTLGDAGIDLISLSIADTSTFGVIRGIVEDSDRALKVLKEAGFTAKTTEVIAVEVPDTPGGLAEVLEHLNDAGLFVEYLYSFVRSKGQNALIIFRVEQLDLAIDVLQKKGIKVLTKEEVYSI